MNKYNITIVNGKYGILYKNDFLKVILVFSILCNIFKHIDETIINDDIKNYNGMIDSYSVITFDNIYDLSAFLKRLEQYKLINKLLE